MNGEMAGYVPDRARYIQAGFCCCVNAGDRTSSTPAGLPVMRQENQRMTNIRRPAVANAEGGGEPIL
jgi:hypothetical protein